MKTKLHTMQRGSGRNLALGTRKLLTRPTMELDCQGLRTHADWEIAPSEDPRYNGAFLQVRCQEISASRSFDAISYGHIVQPELGFFLRLPERDSHLWRENTPLLNVTRRMLL